MNEKDCNTDRFYELVWPARETVLRTAVLLTHQQTLAEEITQETLVKAWRSMQQFDAAGGNIIAWLLTILRHTWVDRVRADGRRGRDCISLEQLNESGNEPADTNQGADSLDIRDADAMLASFSDETMIAALKTLPADMRWTLLLVDVVELSYELAAEVMAVPVGTVRSRASRARQVLRIRLLTRPEAMADERI